MIEIIVFEPDTVFDSVNTDKRISPLKNTEAWSVYLSDCIQNPFVLAAKKKGTIITIREKNPHNKKLQEQTSAR